MQLRCNKKGCAAPGGQAPFSPLHAGPKHAARDATGFLKAACCYTLTPWMHRCISLVSFSVCLSSVGSGSRLCVGLFVCSAAQVRGHDNDKAVPP